MASSVWSDLMKISHDLPAECSAIVNSITIMMLVVSDAGLGSETIDRVAVRCYEAAVFHGESYREFVKHLSGSEDASAFASVVRVLVSAGKINSSELKSIEAFLKLFR